MGSRDAASEANGFAIDLKAAMHPAGRLFCGFRWAAS